MGRHVRPPSPPPPDPDARCCILLPVVAFTGLSLTAALGDSVDVDETAFPWSSVGKIYNSARSSCSGALIARDKVLTAAPRNSSRCFLQMAITWFMLIMHVVKETRLLTLCIVSLYIRNDSNRMERLATDSRQSLRGL